MDAILLGRMTGERVASTEIGASGVVPKRDAGAEKAGRISARPNFFGLDHPAGASSSRFEKKCFRASYTCPFSRMMKWRNLGSLM